MKKFIITILAILLVAIGGYAQEKSYIYMRKVFGLETYTVSINEIKVGTYRGVAKIEVFAGDYFVDVKTSYHDPNTKQLITNNVSVDVSLANGESAYFSVGAFGLKQEYNAEKKYASKNMAVIDFTSRIKRDEESRKVIVENKMDEKQNEAFLEQLQQIKEAVSQQQAAPVAEPTKPQIVSDVDENIPQSKTTSDDTYALIIANEEYEQLDNVNFAIHDGEIFKEYCIKTLGIPEEQIRYCPNATFGKITGGIDWLKFALNNFEGSRGIVYYCGHGIPDEKSGEAFIVPVDGNGTNTTTCYSLNTLYKSLAETKATNVTYLMDACFTGANKEGSMLVAARGVAREPAKATIGGNSVVFSASSGDETAMTYPEKGHGLFTYFLLKKLQETNGEVSYLDLYNYINTNVKKKSFLVNGKPQNPVTATSPAAQNSWRDMKLK